MREERIAFENNMRQSCNVFETICIVMTILAVLYVAYFFWVVLVYRARNEEKEKQAKISELTTDSNDS